MSDEVVDPRHPDLSEPAAGGGLPPASAGAGGDGPVTLTAQLVPESARALEEASFLTGSTRTVTVNRALQLYAWAQRLIDQGARLRVVQADGTELDVQLL